MYFGACRLLFRECKRIHYIIIYNTLISVYLGIRLVLQLGEKSRGCVIEWATRNRLILSSGCKNEISKLQFYKAKVFIYISRIIKILQFIVTGNIKKAIAIVRGIRAARNFILDSRA